MGSLCSIVHRGKTQLIHTEMRQNICNYVHDAEIWKDHVRTAHTASKSWDGRWGYTTKIYNGLHKNLTGKEVFQEKDSKRESKYQKAVLGRASDKQRKSTRLPPISQALPPSITVRADRLKRERGQVKYQFPKTTQDQIGWLAKDLSSRTYGGSSTRTRGKWTLYKQLGWPIESTV